MVPQAKSASHLKYGMKVSGGIPDERSRAASFKSERGNKLDFSVEEREIKSAAEQSSHMHATRLHAVWNLLSETVVMLTRVCTSYTTHLRPAAVITTCVCVCVTFLSLAVWCLLASRSFSLDSALFLLCLGQLKRGKKLICHQSFCSVSTFEIRQLTSDCFSHSPGTFARP